LAPERTSLTALREAGRAVQADTPPPYATIGGATMRFRAASWEGDHLEVLDQTRLPLHEETLRLEKTEDYLHAINEMRIRGAPLIGIVAAYGVAQAALNARHCEFSDFEDSVRKAIANLGRTRPTAVNLFWALRRLQAVLDDNILRTPGEHAAALLAEAQAIHREQVDADRAMAQHGARLIPPGSEVLTICNTGALATGGLGTALGVIIAAHRQQRVKSVFAAETRPRLQGRLTAWELRQHGVPFHVIVDGAVGALLKRRSIAAALVGADRIAANGDVANKIGTYQLAVLCERHGVAFIVVAPRSTFDPDTPTGSAITIEERNADEVRKGGRSFLLPKEYPVWNPAFDVTPRGLVTYYVSEDGVQAGGRRGQ